MKRCWLILLITFLFFSLFPFLPGFCDGCRMMKARKYRVVMIPRSNELKFPTEVMQRFNRCIDTKSDAPFESFIAPTQQAVILYKDGKESLTIEVPPLEDTEFAWVVPTPAYPEVKKGDASIFPKLSNEVFRKLFSKFILNKYTSGMGLTAKGDEEEKKPEPPVIVHERKTVGKFDTAILSAKDPSALLNWLDENNFYFPENGKPALDFYVNKKWYFVAMKVINTEKGESLHPVEFIFKTDKPVYPMKMTSIEGGTSKVNLYVFADREMGSDGLFRIWKGKSKELNMPKEFPPYATVLTYFRENKKIEDDIFLKPSCSKVYYIPLMFPEILTLLAIIIIFGLFLSGILTFKRKGRKDESAGNEENNGSDNDDNLPYNSSGEKENSGIGLTLVKPNTINIIACILYILAAFILYSNFTRAYHQRQHAECSSNSKNVGTALEMYSTDNKGHYPKKLSDITPDYLRVIPTCPLSGDDTFSASYHSQMEPDAYSFYCSNRHYGLGFKPNDFPVVFPPCNGFRIVFMDSINKHKINKSIHYRKANIEFLVIFIILIVISIFSLYFFAGFVKDGIEYLKNKNNNRKDNIEEEKQL